eukprot:1654496-Alexandrium_andersonii.AAC.1
MGEPATFGETSHGYPISAPRGSGSCPCDAPPCRHPRPRCTGGRAGSMASCHVAMQGQTTWALPSPVESHSLGVAFPSGGYC